MTTHDSVRLAGLGYVGVAAPDPVGWRDFAIDVCGLVPSAIVPAPRPQGLALASPDAGGIAADGTVFLKMDRRQWRLAVHPVDPSGPFGESGLAYLGFELRTRDDFERAVDAVRAHGVEIRAAEAEECTARSVERLAVLADPFGHRIELFHAPIVDDAFRSPTGIAFKTGALGMGHAVLYVPDVQAGLSFYRDVLGFRRSDYMTFGPGGMGIHFLRCTPRHHSLALLQIGDLTGLQHVMLESTTLDGVGGALDRAVARGVPITSSLGRHRNDKTVSFYMRGPSGFDVEIGWDGLLVGDDWVEHEFAGGGDEWGHQGLTPESLEPS
jgi:3,4-dihydroxy-9,10-secoandrosta-1,3,5(10)-triene-9,17-dione 4,5-dioxygenase